MTIFLAIFIILHGLVHIWYVVLSLRLVPFQPEMGWSGESWLLSGMLGDEKARSLAAILYLLATLGFVVAGIGMLTKGGWFRPVMILSAALSSVAIILYWDGNPSLLVQKGLLGFVISAFVFLGLVVFSWPSIG
jgi:hypothetical protein